MSGNGQSGSILARVVPDAIRRRFVAKFVVSVVVVMLATAGLGAYFFGTTTATLTDRTDSQIESTAGLQASELGRWVEGLRHQTRLVSQASEFQTLNASRVDYYLLQQHAQFRSDIHAVHFVDTRTWEVLASTSGEAEGANVTRTTAWGRENAAQVAMATNVVSNVFVGSRPYESPAGGERVMAFVSSPPQGTQYLVVVEASLAACEQSFDQPTENAFTTVRTADGDPVCGGTDRADATVPEGVLGTNEAGVVQTEGNVVGHASVNATGWTVLTQAPTSAAYGLRDRIGTSMLALVLVPLVLLGAVAAVVGRRTSGELARLTGHAERMREGDLDVDIETKRADEFGTLARGFAEMRGALKQQIEEADQARTEAEVARAEAVELSDHLQTTAADYSETMSACARGDLTRRLDRDENEAMDRVAADFNEMIRELELTIGQLESFAREVGEGGEDLHGSAAAVRDASEQIADSIQQVSDEAYDQTDRLDALAAEADAVADELAAVAAADGGGDTGSTGGQPASAEPSVDDLADRIETLGEELAAATESAETVMAESEPVAGAAEEQAAELNAVSSRALELQRTARHLGDGISHFETEHEHEFVFQTGVGDSDAAPTSEN